jgi:hypothetical protein
MPHTLAPSTAKPCEGTLTLALASAGFADGNSASIRVSVAGVDR